MRPRRAVFLDRDGVLNELVPDPSSGHDESPLRAADVRLIPGAAEGARRLTDAGFALAVVTNQPAAAKGLVSLQELESIHRRVLELLADEGVGIDGWRMCPHHPQGIVPALTERCGCRKPAAGMLLELAQELGLDLPGSWMIGDTDADVLAGQAAGCRTIQVRWRPSAHKRLGGVTPDLVAGTLLEAANMLTTSVSR